MDLFVVVVEAVQLTSTVQGVLFYVIKNWQVQGVLSYGI